MFSLLEGNTSLLTTREGNSLCIIGMSGVPRHFFIRFTIRHFLFILFYTLLVLFFFLSAAKTNARDRLQALLAALDRFIYYLLYFLSSSKMFEGDRQEEPHM